MENISLEKNILRKKMRSMLREFCGDKNARNDESEKICDIFLSSDIYKNSQLICAFCSLPNEIETMPIIEQAMRDGKRVALPRVIPKTCDMDFYLIENSRAFSEQVISGEYGIREPCACLEKVSVSDIKSHAVFLVPGLAFTKNGARLGKGMSFYDRYFLRLAKEIYASDIQQETDGLLLADKFLKSKIALIGFCFPFQIIDAVPCHLHDVKMSHIIEEKLFDDYLSRRLLYLLQKKVDNFA